MAEIVVNPFKMDDITVKKLEEAFAIGADVSAACFYANISRPTYYNWVKSFPELEERFNSLMEKPVLQAYQTIAKGLSDIDTAKWYLERKRKKEFSSRQEMTGADGTAFIPILSNIKKQDALLGNNSTPQNNGDAEED